MKTILLTWLLKGLLKVYNFINYEIIVVDDFSNNGMRET